MQSELSLYFVYLIDKCIKLKVSLTITYIAQKHKNLILE